MNYQEEASMLDACLQNNRAAQNKLYSRFAPILMPVCRRYAKNSYDAEDILQEGFIKIFKFLSDYKNQGSFEGWMRRIIITTALNYYKKKKITHYEYELQHLPDKEVSELTVVSQLFMNDLMYMVRHLPRGYQNVFNLYDIEGYTHKEIGEMLSISANTSKSQLNRARNQLQNVYRLSNVTYYAETEVLQSA